MPVNSVQITDVCKGFGALAGAYVFAALASRGLPDAKVNAFMRIGEACHEDDSSRKSGRFVKLTINRVGVEKLTREKSAEISSR
jgi:hypothetical protein